MFEGAREDDKAVEEEKQAIDGRLSAIIADGEPGAMVITIMMRQRSHHNRHNSTGLGFRV